MKLSVWVIAILVTTCIFAGCSKGNKDSPTPTSMTATINGSTFSVSSCLFGYNNDTLVIAGGNVNPQIHNAIQLLDPYIALYISNYVVGSPGTFTIGSTASVYIDSNRASGYSITGSTGTITITKSTTTNITGTFNFTCTDGTVVNGMFTANRN